MNTRLQTRKFQHFNRGHMIFALLLMAQLQIWDGIITQVFVINDFAREGNPLMIAAVYDGNFLLIKLLGLAALLPVLWIVFKRFPRLAMTSASCLAVFYLAVVTWNLTVLFAGIA